MRPLQGTNLVLSPSSPKKRNLNPKNFLYWPPPQNFLNESFSHLIERTDHKVQPFYVSMNKKTPKFIKITNISLLFRSFLNVLPLYVHIYNIHIYFTTFMFAKLNKLIIALVSARIYVWSFYWFYLFSNEL